jgi:hypothetical protein
MRSRLDVAVRIEDKVYEFTTNVRDSLEVKKRCKGNVPADHEGALRLAWVAAERCGVFTGTFDEFVDACDDIEVDEPPPLRPAATPETSPQSFDEPESPLITSSE